MSPLQLEFLQNKAPERIHTYKQDEKQIVLRKIVLTLKEYVDYREQLLTAKVMLDPADRRKLIHDAAFKLAEAEGLVLKDDPGLLDEVTGLVEWPVVYMGSIDDVFMDVPAEALISSMRKHQKYFSCLDKAGNLSTRFVVVANTETLDGGKQIIAGISI